MYKVCSGCNKSLELNCSNFHRSEQSKNGFVSRCKICIQKYQREYYNRIPLRLSEPYKKEIIRLLKTTKLSYIEIGNKFGFSSGPVSKVKKEEQIYRPNIRMKNLTKCKNCNITFNYRRSKSRPNSGKFCCKNCYTEWQKSDENRGCNNPNWKHGRDSNIDRKSKEWKTWRLAVYKRDKYTCQFCGLRGNKLNPHHILPRRDFLNKIYDIKNGITLCISCHSKTKNREYGWICRCLYALSFNEATLAYRPYMR